MKRLFLLTTLMFIFEISSAQFITMFNDTILPFGSGAYTFDGICNDDTFYYLLGGVNNYEANWQLMVTKIDNIGNIIKKRKFGDTLIYYASYPYNSIIQKNNSILIISQIVDTLAVVKGCIMEIDKNTLDTLWTKIYPHPDTASIQSNADKFSDLTAIKATPDNCYILTGNYMSAGSLRSYLMKIDSLGNTLWTKTYSDVAHIYDVELSPNGGYVMINKFGGTNFVITDSLGNILWRKKANTYIGMLTAGDLKYSGNNTFVVTTPFMYNSDPNNPLMGVNIFKINIDNQQILWDKTYQLYYSLQCITLHQAMGLETLSDGSIIVSGTLAKTGADLKGFIFKLNSNGDSLWTKTYSFGSPTYDDCQLNDLIVCEDGGFMGVGFFWSHLTNVNDAAWMFKTDANGTIGFEKTVAELVEAKVFPNPATNFVTIEIPENLPQNAELKLYNALGQMVLERQIAKGMRQVQISLKGLERGIYFFELVNDELVIGNGKVVKE